MTSRKKRARAAAGCSVLRTTSTGFSQDETFKRCNGIGGEVAQYDPWIESHTNLSDHWKVHKLAKTINVRYAEALGMLHLLWYGAMRYAWRDGDMTKYGADAIEASCNWPYEKGTLVQALQECGFLNGFKIHDWLDFAGRLIKDRLNYERSNKVRTQSVRKPYGTRTSSVANHTVPDLTLPNQLQSKEPANAEAYRLPDPKAEPAKCLVVTYKTLLGVPFNDRVWDRKLYGRNMAAATSLLHFCVDLETAEECMKQISSELESAGKNWTLETVVNLAPQWLKKNGRTDANASRAGLRSAIAKRRSENAGGGGLVQISEGSPPQPLRDRPTSQD